MSILFKNYVKENKKQFFFLALNLVLISLINIPLPYFSKIIVDNIINSKEYQLILPVIFFFTFIVVMQIILGYISSIQNAKFFQNFIFVIRSSIFQKSIENTYINNSQLGLIQTLMTSDVENLSNNYLTIISTFFNSVILIVSYLAILFLLNVKLALLCIIFIPLYIIWTLFMGEKLKKMNSIAQNKRGQLLSSLTHFMTSLIPIHIYSYFDNARHEFKTVNTENKKINKQILSLHAFFNIMSGTIIIVASFLPFFVGIFFVIHNHLSMGELIAFNGYAMSLFTPLTNLINLLVLFKSSEIFEQRILSVINNTECPKKSIQKSNSSKSNNHVLYIEKMVLKDTSNQLLLNSKNFYINNGEVILLNGDNGTGKSLFLKSIVGLYKNFSGNIFFQNTLISDLDVTTIAKHIIYIDNQQKFVLKDFYHEMEILNSYKIDLNYFFDIVGLDIYTDSIDFQRDSLNNNISAGQAQLLRIIRALIKKPDIIVLDEIFSNISQKKVASIIGNIRAKFPNISIIIVDHHFTNGTLADRCYSIEDKEIIAKNS
ncbi:ABC transporter ATP-binding protein [Enterococcus faecalis]|uniref:ABC transporter ATP-binding protein n=1 Tax=Enterococcus faecalis TaxID=1351 RepID=UPI00226F7C3C